MAASSLIIIIQLSGQYICVTIGHKKVSSLFAVKQKIMSTNNRKALRVTSMFVLISYVTLLLYLGPSLLFLLDLVSHSNFRFFGGRLVCTDDEDACGIAA